MMKDNITTLTEIVSDILKNLSPKLRVEIVSTKEDDLIQFHSSWGRADTDRECPWLHDRLVKLPEGFKPPVLKLQKKTD